MRMDVFGLQYDFDTKRMYSEDGVESKYTFEAPGGYNPMQFATSETADEMALNLGLLCARGTKIEVVRQLSPFMPGPRMIRLTQGDNTMEVNAGLMANSIIRSGMESALNGIRVELNRNGLAYNPPISR